MQTDESQTVKPSHSPGFTHGSSGRAQLSAKLLSRLDRLAAWRISPFLIKFPKGSPEYRGGYATVTQALLSPAADGKYGTRNSNDARDGVAELNGPHVKSDHYVRALGGDDEHREREQQLEKAKPNGVDEEHEQECGETSGRQKVGSNELLDIYNNLPSKSLIPTLQAVAVKKMKITGDPVRILELTLREAEFLIDLSHNNIIKIEGFVEELSKHIVWLVFSWEDNGNLKDFAALTDWEIPERISLINDVARGVEYLHRRRPPICHGDLKSVNILVNAEYRALLTDFGSARRLVGEDSNKERNRTESNRQEAPSLGATFCASTNTITITGNQYTLRWAAPELLQKDQCTLQSDIWALGWVAYEVMTNSIPFQDVKDDIVITRVIQGDLPSIINDARMLLIQALCSLMIKCWSINPSKRPTAKDSRKSIEWMPKIVPNPEQTADTATPRVRSPELLIKLGVIHRRQGDYINASRFFTEALEIYMDISDMEGTATALSQLGHLHRHQSEYSQAVQFFSEALQIRVDIGDRQGRADTLWCLAEVHRARNEHSQAIASYSEALQICTDLRDRRGRANALWGLAEVYRIRNEYSHATMFYTEALQIRTDIAHRQGRAEALWGLAEVHRVRNEYSQAIAFYSEALQIRIDIGHRRGKAEALQGLADVHRARNELSQAIKFYLEALQIRTEIGHRRGRADALLGLAEVHRLQHEYNEAIKLYSDALQIFTEIGDGYGKALTLLGRAEVYQDQDDYINAVHHYGQAAETFERIGLSKNATQTLRRAAYVRLLLEQKEAAWRFAGTFAIK